MHNNKWVAKVGKMHKQETYKETIKIDHMSNHKDNSMEDKIKR
jgi:hypothetical protein